MNAFMIRDSAFLIRDSVDHRLQTRISELVELARKAFADRRRQDCSAIAKAILELDPKNDDALFIQSWIQCEVEQDLQLAYSLLPDLKKDETLCKEAQLIVQRVLELDPGNKAAEALRLEVGLSPADDSSGHKDVVRNSDLLVDELEDPQPAIESVADLQSTPESVEDLQPAHEPIADHEPLHESVEESRAYESVEPRAYESVEHLQLSYEPATDSVPVPERISDSVADSTVDESLFESVVPDLPPEYARWGNVQPAGR